MVGGMASSAILTLLVIPAIYAAVKGFGLRQPEVQKRMDIVSEPKLNSPAP